MPSLDSLPAEVLLAIARFVGGGYLRARTDRLLVCKAWFASLSISVWDWSNTLSRYGSARSVAFEDLYLTVETLQHFLAAPDRTHDLVKTSVRKLFIAGEHIDAYNEMGATLHGKAEKWIVNVCESLLSFTTHLPQMAGLWSFRLELLVDSIPSKRLEDLWNKAMVTLVSSASKICH
jgi:hypothetical protein